MEYMKKFNNWTKGYGSSLSYDVRNLASKTKKKGLAAMLALLMTTGVACKGGDSGGDNSKDSLPDNPDIGDSVDKDPTMNGMTLGRIDDKNLIQLGTQDIDGKNVPVYSVNNDKIFFYPGTITDEDKDSVKITGIAYISRIQSTKSDTNQTILDKELIDGEETSYVDLKSAMQVAKSMNLTPVYVKGGFILEDKNGNKTVCSDEASFVLNDNNAPTSTYNVDDSAASKYDGKYMSGNITLEMLVSDVDNDKSDLEVTGFYTIAGDDNEYELPVSYNTDTGVASLEVALDGLGGDDVTVGYRVDDGKDVAKFTKSLGAIHANTAPEVSALDGNLDWEGVDVTKVDNVSFAWDSYDVEGQNMNYKVFATDSFAGGRYDLGVSSDTDFTFNVNEKIGKEGFYHISAVPNDVMVDGEEKINKKYAFGS